jgi:hypothetical protein
VTILLNRLKKSVSDERELDAILKYASGGSQQILPNGEVIYKMADANNSIYAKATIKNGRIRSLTPGPALRSNIAQDALVENAKYQTALIHGNTVATRVLLSERKLTGSFAWNGKIKIKPCPVSAPIRSGLDWFTQSQIPNNADQIEGPPFPFTLQVTIAQSPNHIIQANRTFQELDKFQYLLTLLISGNIRTFENLHNRVWVQVYQNNVFENHLLYQGFNLGEEPEANELDRIAPLFKGDADYYNHIWARDEEIYIPPSLAADLELFNSLGDEEKQKFNRATYWYDLGLRNRKESSLSTVAFASAIECLLPEKKRERCADCNSEIGPGPTKLFKDHLSRYGIVPESLHIQRNELYTVRSKLVHGRFAKTIDEGYFSNTNDHSMLLELVTRRSLLNWLRNPERTS